MAVRIGVQLDPHQSLLASDVIVSLHQCPTVGLLPRTRTIPIRNDEQEISLIVEVCFSEEAREQACQVHIGKTRRGVSRLQPIIWKLNIRRHYGRLWLVPCQDLPWEQKKNQAIFRGKISGDLRRDIVETDMEKCLAIPRCRLILDLKASKLVDARLTSMENVLPDSIGGVKMTAPVFPMHTMLSYKGLVILEGNDVSSGLKWALLSSSVVLMPEPMFTSWAMEELLEPWVHYIPIKNDFSDLEEKVSWMLTHDAEARRISHRASLWIKDLVYHPDAQRDEEIIFREILNRYQRQFVSSIG